MSSNDAAEIVRDGKTVKASGPQCPKCWGFGEHFPPCTESRSQKPLMRAPAPKLHPKPKDTFLQILGRIEGHLAAIENLYPQECGGYCDLMKQDVEALKLAHNVMQYEMSIERSKGDEPQTD